MGFVQLIIDHFNLITIITNTLDTVHHNYSFFIIQASGPTELTKFSELTKLVTLSAITFGSIYSLTKGCWYLNKDSFGVYSKIQYERRTEIIHRVLTDTQMASATCGGTRTFL